MLRSLAKLCGSLLWVGGAVALAQQYSITTVAGGAPPPTPVAATSASIGQPGRVTVDSKGNIYFSSLHAVFKIDSGGNLTVVAGNSRPGFSGDNGPATQAQLNSPQGLAVDSSGNLYIADSQNNRVRMVNTAGIITTFAGTGQYSPTCCYTVNDGGLATQGLLHLPSGVAVDSNGNVYIADTADNLVRKVTTDGLINTLAGDGYAYFYGDDGPAVNGELHSPEDVWVDSSFNVYIADSANGVIRKVTTDGVIHTIVGNNAIGSTGDGGLATDATMTAPFSVCLDSSGNIYIVENGDSKIRKVTASTGDISTIAGTGTAGFGGDGGAPLSAQFNSPTGIAIDSSGSLYIADSLNRRIRKVTSSAISTIAGNGVLSYSGDGGAARSAQLNAPLAVAADANGNFYIADTGNHVVRKVDAGGNISTIAGKGSAGSAGDGGASTSAQLNTPQGVAVDGSGNIYISDTQNFRVRKIAAGTGVITTYAGNGTPGSGGDNAAAGSAQLNTPAGLAVDAKGNLYIADFTNNRIRKVDTAGTITTVAGNGLAGYSGDGGPATNAQLTTPSGVAVDSSGNLFIADTGNNVVRKVDTNGLISTVAGNSLAGYSGDDGLATSAQVTSPTAVAVDSSGNLYIADGSVRVRKVYTTGFIVTIAGNGTRGYAGDGGVAPNASLSAPASLALAPNGNVYVADSGNSAIRLLLLGGYQLKISSIASAASNLAGPISGGEIVVLYGSGLGPANLVAAPNGAYGALSKSLAGTIVYFGNYAAPVLYTWATQVAAIVPYEVSGQIQVFVNYQGQLSAPVTASVASATPGIFTSDLSGKNLASALNIRNGAYSYNSAANPANAGDLVEIVLTGTGQTVPAGVDGQPYSGLSSCALTPVTVTVGGKSVTPQYCGGAPTAVAGVTQINFQVPSGLAAGLVPVSVQFGSISTQPGVTIAVSGK